MRDFKGKTAFLTGAANGMGLGMAITFAKAGMNVIISDIHQGDLETAVHKSPHSSPKKDIIQEDHRQGFCYQKDPRADYCEEMTQVVFLLTTLVRKNSIDWVVGLGLLQNLWQERMDYENNK